jgi:iron-sulfur cluster assembly accessory protein
MAVNEPLTAEAVETEEALQVTPAALNTIRMLLEQRNIPGYALRVFVSGGGCSGLQYGMAFEQEPRDFDAVVETDGVKLVIDPTSLMYLQGATIDYVDSLMGGGFRVENPNAVSSCGCGHSFRTKDSAEAEAGGCGSCSN